ncbi:hypothetical protein N7489_000278 [Penicillium chrysogenum]|uniref:uncharacterized protein n=1 Tax=Penicillium chrysogenum TaxID=5076 RepID=UPI0024DF10E9|nr:uncharacterized protein N7489_000278 [Penicillium chrysogenum]KAJ5249868.1 hypothetical protein N7489_000278 [Penicillium chrysogenum]
MDGFASYPNIEYATLDISKDPSDQGFDGRKYALILATNVIHATASLNDSLSNVRKLLSPTGWFLLHELTPTSKWINYIFGTLAGWWYGDADSRSDEPYIGAERWARELQAAGFRTPEAAVLDSDHPYQLNAMIVARPEVDISPKRCVTLLAFSESRSIGPLLQVLEGRGLLVHHSWFVSLEKLIDVYEKFQARQEDENLKPEFEYAIVDNTVKVGRYHPFSLKDEQQTLCSNGSMALQTSKPGRLAALHWAYEDTKTLKGDEVEIETYVTGLNFKDVLCAMGIVEAKDDEFGHEGAGIVRRIGPEVQGLKRASGLRDV